MLPFVGHITGLWMCFSLPHGESEHLHNICITLYLVKPSISIVKPAVQQYEGRVRSHEHDINRLKATPVLCLSHYIKGKQRYYFALELQRIVNSFDNQLLIFLKLNVQFLRFKLSDVTFLALPSNWKKIRRHLKMSP